MVRRAPPAHFVFFLASSACAPVTWHESTSVVAREIADEGTRRAPDKDTVDATVELRGDVVVVRAEHALMCTSEVKEKVTVEHTRRAEPSSAVLVLDYGAILTGGIAGSVGSGLVLACIGQRGEGGACDAAGPVLLGGVALAALGVTALIVDASKRKTKASTTQDVRSWGTSTQPCERAPIRGATIALARRDGATTEERADEQGVARFSVAEARGPLEVEVRVDGRLVKAQRLR
ncbi:MAG: hypothetical protein KF819_05065 [Labilithrix sp.]|nr:hypothetical protein [Labilithrix sp.]